MSEERRRDTDVPPLGGGKTRRRNLPFGGCGWGRLGVERREDGTEVCRLRASGRERPTEGPDLSSLTFVHEVTLLPEPSVKVGSNVRDLFGVSRMYGTLVFVLPRLLPSAVLF